MEQKEKLPRPRGRPRAYDPEQALQQATAAFWQAGYASTSLDDLTAATGMNRPSLYAAFGDKRALYLAALQAYTEASRAAIADTLAGSRSLRAGFQHVFDLALKIYQPAQGPARGCFLIGTAAAESLNDAEVQRTLHDALRSFDAAFAEHLHRAREAGTLPPGADPAMLARLLSALLHSLALRSRAGDARAELAATAAAGLQLILPGA